jgi:hypothetical protein
LYIGAEGLVCGGQKKERFGAKVFFYKGEYYANFRVNETTASSHCPKFISTQGI